MCGEKTISPSLRCQEDHPRMCGEKATSAAVASGELGSPPHVRGKVDKHKRQYNDEGITPACAGKSHHSK